MGTPVGQFLAAIVLLLALGAARPVRAEEREGIAHYTVWSPNGRYVAVLDPASYDTTVYRVARPGEQEPLWSMPGWFRYAAISDDGEHLVVGAELGGVVRADYDPAEVLLTFYDRGRPLRSVTLGEIVPDPHELIRSGPWYLWGRFVGFDSDGRYQVETNAGRLAFDEKGRLAH